MSVINKMLKELEARGAQPTLDAHLPLAATLPVRRTSPSRQHMLLAALILAGASFAAGHLLHTAPDTATTTTAGKPAPTAAVAAPAAPTPHDTKTLVAAAKPAIGMLKALAPRQPRPANAASAPLLTGVDRSGSTAPVSVPAELTHTQAQASGYLMIDPPAAGMTQSVASRAALAYRRALDWSEQGRQVLALESAQEALQLDPGLVEARRLAASLALDRQQLSEAGSLIAEGLTRDPRDAELQYLRARQLVASGQDEQALAVLSSAADLTANAHGLKAGLLARSGRYAEAAAAYQHGLRSKPSNATWWLGLGVALDAQGQAASAREAFARASALGTLRADVQTWVEQKLALAR